METLPQNIQELNNIIKELENEIQSIESQIETQQEIANQAMKDNSEKKNFNEAVDAIKNLNTNAICSVCIQRTRLQPVIDMLIELQNYINSVNISGPKELGKLEDLEESLETKKSKLSESKALKQSYQTQLRIQLKRKEEELEALKRLLDDME